MALLDELKEYLRIDHESEDSILLSFITASQLYLDKTGVTQPIDYYLIEDGKDIYALLRLAIMMLATHFYENRIVFSEKSNPMTIPYGLESIILQLKAEALPSESDIV